MSRLIDNLIMESDCNVGDNESYVFTYDELISFVTLVLKEVSKVTDPSEIVPTGPTLNDWKLHFGITQAPSEEEETPIDWHGFNDS
jgi:hypothetical protein